MNFKTKIPRVHREIHTVKSAGPSTNVLPARVVSKITLDSMHTTAGMMKLLGNVFPARKIARRRRAYLQQPCLDGRGKTEIIILRFGEMVHAQTRLLSR